MIQSKLCLAELLDSMRRQYETIWLITLKEGMVEILSDILTPQLTETMRDYGTHCSLYEKNMIYPADLPFWRDKMSLASLREIARSGCQSYSYHIRFRSDVSGFEWHTGILNILKDEAGNPDRILLLGRNINEDQKAKIIGKAVENEYDYVAYIEADKNSYVMYSDLHEGGVTVPPTDGSDYEAAVAAFHSHRNYWSAKEQTRLTEQMSIRHVQPILKRYGEYITYCKVLENGSYRDKKLRFSFFDQEKNIWLLTRADITEVREEKRQKKLLQDALNAATVANRAKSEFLSRMSHDIRTPMNAIIGMTSIAGVHIDDKERVLDCLSKITGASKLLLGLINEVLDMSKVESGSILLSEEEINLAELVQSVVSMTQPSIDEKSLSFSARANGVRHEYVTGDTQRIQQVLLNLLSNAVKYTPQGGHILFEVSEKPSGRKGEGRFEFLVEDDGIGMTPEFLEKIFQPFERADEAAIRSIQGTGLGMAISKSVVEMMDGDIRVESVYGSGSRFTASVCLKLMEEPSSDERLFDGLPILVVDDDEAVCQNTCTRLNEMGIDSQWVRTGREAVDKTLAAHEAGDDFFAVIVDLKMPGMDGIETTRQIRARVGAEIPIIIISAYDYIEYERAALEAGANGFIMKPLFRSRLACQLKHFVDKEPVQKTDAVKPLIQGDFNGKRVLLAEDNALNQEIAVELLTSAGLLVEAAGNGKEALDKMAGSPQGYYQLIFMDMQMPVMDGCEASRLIRGMEREDARAIPIIAMTANAFAEDMAKTKSAGMNEHMAKPIDMNLLTHILHRYLD